MSHHIVSISDCAVTNDREQSLITYALGSCIAVAIHDRTAGVAGLLHFMSKRSRTSSTLRCVISSRSSMSG